MTRSVTLTFEEGCNKYLENCRQRNLREGTIGHYRQSYTQFYKFFDPKMPIEDIDEQLYKDYVLHLKATLDNDVSINSYLRDLITTIHFFMNEGWLPHFRMQAIKVDKSHIICVTGVPLYSDGIFISSRYIAFPTLTPRVPSERWKYSSPSVPLRFCDTAPTSKISPFE